MKSNVFAQTDLYKIKEAINQFFEEGSPFWASLFFVIDIKTLPVLIFVISKRCA